MINPGFLVWGRRGAFRGEKRSGAEEFGKCYSHLGFLISIACGKDVKKKEGFLVSGFEIDFEDSIIHNPQSTSLNPLAP